MILLILRCLLTYSVRTNRIKEKGNALAQEIKAKSQALARFHRGDPVIFLTLHTYLIPKVSGVCSQIPIGDLLGETMTKGEDDGVLDYIKASEASEIYVDPPPEDTKERVGNYQVKLFEKLLLDLKVAYRADRFVGGWNVWVRKNDHESTYSAKSNGLRIGRSNQPECCCRCRRLRSLRLGLGITSAPHKTHDGPALSCWVNFAAEGDCSVQGPERVAPGRCGR